MEVDIGAVAVELAAAVEVTMDANAGQAERLEAYKACEAFKERNPLCVQAGLYLAQRPGFSHFVRHFGLQLMEHSIKYRWYNMTHHEKLFIKENAMRLVECGLECEEAHMRDALSRVVVEMIKREWPQQWASLLSELNQCCSRGCPQTELVLLVLLRLVEDVAVLQTLESNQRRKDIYQALTTNMADLFSFFLGLLDKHLKQYHTLCEAGNLQEAGAHARVVQVILLTLSGFVEWVAMTHIMVEDGRLLQILCLLLNNEHFQDGAAECLLQILSRKGKVEERRPLMILFSTEAMTCIFQSVDRFVDKNYQFLKKLTRVLTGVGSLWSKAEGGWSRPPTLEVFLEAIVALSRHPSLTLVGYTNTLWVALMRHEHIPADPVFLDLVPKWVAAVAPKIVKVLYPSCKATVEPNSAEAFAVLDYYAEDEFNAFFHRFRVDLLDTLKQATVVAPQVTFSYVEQWLEVEIHKTVSQPPAELCTLSSRAYLDWEAVSLALDAVLSRAVQGKDPPDVARGLRLLDLCLALEPTDPLILSAMLSCISALFVFLTIAPLDVAAVYLPRVLDKIFATLVFTLPGETKKQRSRGVKNVRRHAASLMVKIAHKYPLPLLPFFSRIHSIVVSLQNKPDTLSTMEVICLQEALLLLSNHLGDFERQSRFVGEVTGGISEAWLGMAATAFTSTEAFMAFVGLDKPPVEPSSDDVNGQNRSQIMRCVDMLVAVVKRVSWPPPGVTWPPELERGGLVGNTSSGAPIYRSPAAPHVLPLLPGLLMLLRALNGLATPQALASLSQPGVYKARSLIDEIKLSVPKYCSLLEEDDLSEVPYFHSLALLRSGYQGAYLMLELERQNLMGGLSSGETASGDAKETTPLQRMQNFISSVHDNSYHALAHALHTLSHDVYHAPALAQSLVSTVFSNLEFVADFRMRSLVRVFLKALVTCCPPTCYESVILPVLGHFAPYMFARLSTRWQHMMEMRENSNVDDDNTESQEMVEDMVTRTLTREYLDVVKAVLYGEATEEESELPRQSETVSELGLLVLQSEATSLPITLCLFRALGWGDSLASLKASGLVGGVVLELAQRGLASPELASQALTAVLLGLHQHGRHDANLGSLLLLGTLIYATLRPHAPHLPEVMSQIPNVNCSDVRKLDEKMLRDVVKGSKVDKSKKDMFKKITSPLISCDVGQLFRKKVVLRDLPKMAVSSRSPPPPVEVYSISSLFQPSDPT